MGGSNRSTSERGGAREAIKSDKVTRNAGAPVSWEGTRGSSWEVSKETAPRPFPVVSRTGMEHISVAFQTLTVWPTECARESLHTAVPPDICLEGSQTDRCVRAAAPDSEPAQGPRDKMLHWRPGVPRVGCHLSDKSQVSQEPAPLWHSDQARGLLHSAQTMT